MEDHHFIPEFSPIRMPIAHSNVVPISVPSPEPRPRRFTKGDAVAEIRERSLREIQLLEWALVLNGRVVTTRQFGDGERADYDRELYAVATDLTGSGWREDREALTSVA